MHELGHALGLAHEDDEYNIMGEDFTHIHAYGNTATAYPGEDASLGAVRLYGPTIVPREDVSVVHWRRTGVVQDEYSDHAPTRILDANGVELAAAEALSPNNMDPGAYAVRAGQEIQVEFSFENNGSTDQAHVPVVFVLSRDTLLSFGDVFLADAHPTLDRNNVYTRTQVIHLPGNLVSGVRYRILAVVDPWNSIPEVFEDNNITYSRAFVVQ
jgi:CARDB protein